MPVSWCLLPFRAQAKLQEQEKYVSTAAAREGRLQEALREQEGEATALKQQLQKLSGDFRWARTRVQVYYSRC